MLCPVCCSMLLACSANVDERLDQRSERSEATPPPRLRAEGQRTMKKMRRIEAHL